MVSRNYFSAQSSLSPAEALIEKAAQLKLTVPEMTVLVGGLRVLDANSGGVPPWRLHGQARGTQ